VISVILTRRQKHPQLQRNMPQTLIPKAHQLTSAGRCALHFFTRLKVDPVQFFS